MLARFPQLLVLKNVVFALLISDQLYSLTLMAEKCYRVVDFSLKFEMILVKLLDHVIRKTMLHVL